MRALFLAAGLCLAVTCGVLCALHFGGRSWGLAYGPYLLTTAALILIITRALAVASFTPIVMTIFLCGYLRGLTGIPAPTPPPQIPTGPASLVGVTVHGASTPGSRCEVGVNPDLRPDLRWSISLPPEACPLASGDTIWLLANEVGDRPDPLPGATSAEQRAQKEGVHRRIWASKFWRKTVSRSLFSAYWQWVAQTRQTAWEWARGQPARGFVMASALGLARSLPPEQRNDLRAAGLGHVIAVSGMHVGVAAILIYSMSLRIGTLLAGSLAFGALLSWLPVAGYVGLTGGAASAVRAALMFTLLHIAAVCGRQAHGLTTLAIAGAVLLCAHPPWAVSAGFHLSFAAMAALVQPDAPAGIVSQSWHVTWATVPVSQWYFGTAALYGAFSNLVAIPVFTIYVVPTAIFGLFVAPFAGPEMLTPAARGAELILDVAALMARLPVIPGWAIAVFASLVLAIRLWLRHRGRRPNRWLPGALTCAGIVVVGAISHVWPATRQASVALPPGATVVVGTPKRFSSLHPGNTPHTACLQNPVLSAWRWPGLLTALGYRGVTLEVVQSSRTTSPHLDPVRERLRDADLWLGQQACPASPAWARESLTSCISMHRRAGYTTRTALVAQQPTGMRMCFLAGSWQKLENFGTHTP